MTHPRIRHIIGCMTGTSLDGLDAALTRVTGEGLAIRAELVAVTSQPLGDLAETLRSMAGGAAHAPIDYLRAARRLGELHAAACATLSSPGERSLDLIVAHGQTIWHAPQDGVGRLSWQLFDPWPIVRRLGVPVCFDLRQADLIAGGEGAPITPLADWVMYRDHAAAVVNLGGIANLTLLGQGPGDITGGDVGPCNLLLDGLSARLIGERYDRDGRCAASGRVVPAVRDLIVRHIAGASGGVSLGREDFSPAWLDALTREMAGLTPSPAPADVLRSAAQVTAETIGARLPARGRIVLAGGGTRHAPLVAALAQTLGPDRVRLSGDGGIPSEAREAMAFAVLGALSQDGVPITLPKVTGAADPGRAGAWVYP